MSRKHYGLSLVVMMLSLFLSGQAFSQGTFVIADSAARLISSQRYELARSYLEDSLKVYQNDPPLLRLLGDAYRGLKNYDKAVDSYDNAIEAQHCDKCFQDFEKAGAISLEGGDNDKALGYLTTALQRGSTIAKIYIAQIYMNRGDSLYNQQYHKLAIKYYKQGLEFVQDTLLYQQLLLCYYKLSEFDSLIDLSKKLIIQFPNFYAARGLLSTMYKQNAKAAIEDKKYSEAIRYFNLLETDTQDHYDSYVGLGTCYDSLNEKELAANYYELALSHQSSPDQLSYTLGKLYHQFGCYPEALRALFHGIDNSSYSIPSWVLLSRVFLDLKDTSSSLFCSKTAALYECEQGKMYVIGQGITLLDGYAVAECINEIDTLHDSPEYVDVQKQPIPIVQVQPDFPEIAKRAGVTGTVWVRCLVTKEGTVKKALVMKSDAEIFNAPAIAAALQWKFTPAIAEGKPVPVWAAIPFRFILHR